MHFLAQACFVNIQHSTTVGTFLEKIQQFPIWAAGGALTPALKFTGGEIMCLIVLS